MTILHRLNTTVALAAGVLILGCSAGGDSSETSETLQSEGAGELPADHPPISPGGALAAASGPAGVVQELVDGRGYTYARVAVDGDEIWTAGPVTELSVGDTVALIDPMPMENFRSEALDRTFDVLYFVGGYGSIADIPDSSGGAVLQVLAAAGYTYLEVEVDGDPIWLAAPETEVSEGDQVVWQGGDVMQDFPSRTLDRTFDSILFVEGVTVVR